MQLIPPQEFKRVWWERAGFSADQARQLLRVSKATWWRWTTQGVPWQAYTLMCAFAGVILVPGWEDWCFVSRTGLLVSHNNHEYGPGDIEAMTFNYALVASLKTEIRLLRDELDKWKARAQQSAKIIQFPTGRKS